MPPEVIGVRRVTVTMEAMQQVDDIEGRTAGETDEFKDGLLDKGPKIMMCSGGSELKQSKQALVTTILRVAQAGMPPDDVSELWRLVLSRYKAGSTWG